MGVPRTCDEPPPEHMEFSRDGKEFNANLSKARISRRPNLSDWEFFSGGAYVNFRRRTGTGLPVRHERRHGQPPGAPHASTAIPPRAAK